MKGIPEGLLGSERTVKPGLERTQALLERLGHPESRFPAIHVGGTNGKGSVVAFLESVLLASDIKAGAYTSPDLGDPTERIRVGGVRIPEETLASLILEAVEPVQPLEEGPGRPTFFEAMTAAALAHFDRQGVDLALVEVGLGGRYDATRCLAWPLLTLVTSVERDHVEFFGPGLHKAAWEKAGIAASGVPLLTAETKGDVLAVLTDVCRDSGAALTVVQPDDVELVELSWDRAVWASRSDPLGLERFETSLLGVYQAQNLSLVLAALAELSGGLEMRVDTVREGLRVARWPGRFELVHRRPWVVLDGAHNPSAARGLLATLERLAGSASRRTLLFGALRGKLVREMADVLFPHFDEVVLVTPSSDRAIPAEALVPQARRKARAWQVAGSVAEAAQQALARAREDELVLMAGSLTVVGEARRVLEAVT